MLQRYKGDGLCRVFKSTGLLSRAARNAFTWITDSQYVTSVPFLYRVSELQKQSATLRVGSQTPVPLLPWARI